MKKSSYEPEKDALVEDLGPVGDTGLFAEVRSYDGGPPKLSIFRPLGTKGKRRQLVRLSTSETTALIKFLTEFAVAHGIS